MDADYYEDMNSNTIRQKHAQAQRSVTPPPSQSQPETFEANLEPEKPFGMSWSQMPIT